MNTKIKSYNNRVIAISKNIDNDNNELFKEGFACICLSAIVTDPIFNSSEYCYPQAPLEEYQYTIKETEIKSLIVDHLESSSDEGSSDEKNGIGYPPF